jgi:predicted nucleic acid-binding protein
LFLVDTSVWVDFLRGISTAATGKFKRILAEEQRFGITNVIYQEVLQGAKSEAHFARLESFLRNQVFYHPMHPLGTYTEAARIYAQCRRAGVTIRSSIDCLIAQIAIEHGLFLLHSDRDFDLMAPVIPELKTF